jgi:predicted DCC family thiol-disulfide oxidoreductase YuxK
VNTEITDKEKLNGWVLYDGDCRLCTNNAHRFEAALTRRRFTVMPLQTPWIREKLRLPDDGAWKEMRLLKPGGEVIGCVDALLEIARYFWWAWPFRQASRIPVVKRWMCIAYQWVAERRKCINGSCQISGHSRAHKKRVFFRNAMKTLLPTMHGLIDRRMLVNFRVRPDVVKKLLPNYFRPKLVNGWAMAGICLIRLKDIRPCGFPRFVGLDSENAAHRIAVEWDADGAVCEGVFIPRRDTSSRLQMLVGGRFFPGVHHLAEFKVKETGGRFELQMRARDGNASIGISARVASKIPSTSVFGSLEEASNFFARGPVGYSATGNPNRCDCLELHTAEWRVEALDVESVSSSFFEDTTRFPKGAVQFDCALLMENVEHEWRILPTLEVA